MAGGQGRQIVRLPRFFGKKRGHRRTGSQAWGSFGEGLFYCVLLVAGLGFAGLLLSGAAAPEWRVNHEFLETPCTIIGKGLARYASQEADSAGSFTNKWQPCLRLRYRVAGALHESWSTALPRSSRADQPTAIAQLAAWRLNDELTCWYDPADPNSVVLERGYNWWLWLLMLLLPGALIVFGGSGLVQAIRVWGKSEEHRAASAGLPEMLDPMDHSPSEAPDHPGVPICDDLINSPGTILRYRLPIESPESWTLLGLGLFAMLWNAVVIVLAVGAGLDLLGGTIDWLLFALLVPFVVVGIASVCVFLRGLILATAVGTTQLEISAHPLRPGEQYDVLLGQGGSGTFRTLTMTLELVEQATFRQGTDTRTEQVVVWKEQVNAWHDIHLVPNARFESRVRIFIPHDAMHSFTSEHNAVNWRIVVHGSPERWPAFSRIFPLIVFPSQIAPLASKERSHRSRQEGVL